MDGAGARALLGGCRGGVSGENIALDVVRSKIGFTSDHFAPVSTSAAARRRSGAGRQLLESP